MAAVCVTNEGFEDENQHHFSYGVVNGNQISYNGEFIDGEGRPQTQNIIMGSPEGQQGNWALAPIDISQLGCLWTAPGSQQPEFGNSGGGGDFDSQQRQEWVDAGMWQPSASPGAGDADWRGGMPTRSALNAVACRPKRRFCTSYPDVSMCRRGAACAFAHSREEINAPLLDIREENQEPAALTDEFFMYKYKTRWCPIGVPHEWHTCVYAHNYQDARRPVSTGYGARLCPYWSKKDTGAEYSQRCPLGLRCPYSHGAKEQLYHPHYFKTVVCRDVKGKACPRLALCAFFHSKSEKRVSPSDDVDYSQPLRNEALPADWVADFLAPPFLPDGGKGGEENTSGMHMNLSSGQEKIFDGPGPVPTNQNAITVVPQNQQVNGNGQQNQFPQMQAMPMGAAPGQCVFLVPMQGMMPQPPNNGGGAQAGMNADMQQMQSSQGMQGMQAQWVLVPMDGNGSPTF